MTGQTNSFPCRVPRGAVRTALLASTFAACFWMAPSLGFAQGFPLPPSEDNGGFIDDQQTPQSGGFGLNPGSPQQGGFGLNPGAPQQGGFGANPRFEEQQGQPFIGGNGFDPGAAPVDRIIGGEPTSKSQWRSFARIFKRVSPTQGSVCGGTIISDRWVLTAGHCVTDSTAADFLVTENIDNLEVGGHDMRVDRVIQHPRFGGDRFLVNDIALLHLSSPAQSPPQPLMGGRAQLPSRLTVAGFGLTTPQPVQGPHSGPGSNVLLQVTLPTVPRPDCKRILGSTYGMQPDAVDFISESTVCAGDVAGGRDSCNGDSGGPLVADIDRKRVQVGVVSWGPGCAVRDTVGVYTSVAYFQDFIRQNVRDAVFVTAATPDGGGDGVGIGGVGALCGLPALPNANTRVRIDVQEGDRLRIGTPIHIRSTAAVSGQVVIVNVDARTCRTFQVFPNDYTAGAQAGNVTPAGAMVSVPAIGEKFSIQAGEPAGPNRLYAIVVPPGVQIRDIAVRGANMQSTVDAASLWQALDARIRQQGGGALPADAVGTFAYEIVR